MFIFYRDFRVFMSYYLLGKDDVLENGLWDFFLHLNFASKFFCAVTTKTFFNLCFSSPSPPM